MKVYVDPGHGGKDSGAVGFGTEEDDIALAVAFKLKSALERCGTQVRMSRTGETYPSLQDRCAQANNWGADLFVSTHFDCGPASAHGVSVLYVSTKGKDLAGHIYGYVQPLTPLPDRGLSLRPELAVLNGTHMPAVIVEGGFISNSQEHGLMVNPAWQGLEAEAITHGVCDFAGIRYVAPFRSTATPPAPKLSGKQVFFGALVCVEYLLELEAIAHRRGLGHDAHPVQTVSAMTVLAAGRKMSLAILATSAGADVIKKG